MAVARFFLLSFPYQTGWRFCPEPRMFKVALGLPWHRPLYLWAMPFWGYFPWRTGCWLSLPFYIPTRPRHISAPSLPIFLLPLCCVLVLFVPRNLFLIVLTRFRVHADFKIVSTFVRTLRLFLCFCGLQGLFPFSRDLGTFPLVAVKGRDLWWNRQLEKKMICKDNDNPLCHPSFPPFPHFFPSWFLWLPI